MDQWREAERKAKQSYLVAEIVDLNYDPNLFLEFCEKKKSSNIDEWSFEELEKCTKEFKDMCKVSGKGVNDKPDSKAPQSKPSPISPASTPSKPFSTLSKPSPVPDYQKLSQQAHKLIFKDSELITIETIRCIKTELDSQEKLKIIVCNPELIDPGFLSSKYYVYVVNTLPINWIVRRKIEEFLWLRETLTVLYPGVFIPSIHKSTKTRPEDKGLFKRQVMYSSFLNNLVSSPLLRNNEYVLAFLKDEDLKTLIKHTKKLQKSRDISSVTSYDGEIQVVYSEMTEQFEALNNFLAKSEKSLIEVLGKIKKLIADSVILSDSIKALAGQIGLLTETYANVNNFQSHDVFVEVKHSLIMWADNYMKSTKIIYEDLKLPLNIFKQELVSLREMLKDRESLIAFYRNKEKSRNFKDYFAFLTFACLSEAGLAVTQAVRVLKNKVNTGFVKKKEETVEFHMVWGNLIASMSVFN